MRGWLVGLLFYFATDLDSLVSYFVLNMHKSLYMQTFVCIQSKHL